MRLKKSSAITALGSNQHLDSIEIVSLPSFNNLHSTENLQLSSNEKNQFQTSQHLLQQKLKNNHVNSKERQFKFQQETRQCRICLQNSLQSQKALIKICKCSGSVQLIHKECFKEWVEKALPLKQKKQRKKILLEKQIQCQMCKFLIPIRFQQFSELIKFQITIARIKARTLLFIIIMLIFIGSLSSLIYAIIKLATINLSLQKNNQNFISTLILLSSSVFSIVITGISLFFLIEEYFLEVKYKISQIGNIEESILNEVQNKTLSQSNSPLIQGGMRYNNVDETSLISISNALSLTKMKPTGKIYPLINSNN